MTNVKTAQDLSCQTISSEIKIAVLYKDENDGAVAKISQIMSIARRTVYDYLDGKIKPSLLFLHAACVATNGDPDIRKFLEPAGWELIRKDVWVCPDKDSIEAECLDDLPLLAEYHKVLTDSSSKQSQVITAMEAAQQELTENYVLWCRYRKLNP